MDPTLRLQDVPQLSKLSLEALLNHFGEGATVGEVLNSPHAEVLRPTILSASSKQITDELLRKLTYASKR